jgi:hypothetical protein
VALTMTITRIVVSPPSRLRDPRRPTLLDRLGLAPTHTSNEDRLKSTRCPADLRACSK